MDYLNLYLDSLARGFLLLVITAVVLVTTLVVIDALRALYRRSRKD